MDERTYFRSTEHDAIYRNVIDEATETFMSYFARPGLRTWGRNRRLRTEIGMGDVGAELITRDKAMQILKEWGVAPDDFDNKVSVET